ncbi:DUF960 family protein [Agathobaculum sp. Marseille-P7918]|uniref:DUF960 family protein n=1 Tax=Agathobaculum sp. Marseille-P7918 TaxID=2479843 RepID=UPI000F62F2C5|nr:DUF960 family protein [Agathobaculum sp. Marseille-P7918]
MSDLPKYVSRNLEDLIPCWLIHLLWMLWAEIPKKQRGKVQYFYLAVREGKQQVRLEQPIPLYERTICLASPEPLDAVVVITETATGITMHLINEPR